MADQDKRQDNIVPFAKKSSYRYACVVQEGSVNAWHAERRGDSICIFIDADSWEHLEMMKAAAEKAVKRTGLKDGLVCGRL